PESPEESERVDDVKDACGNISGEFPLIINLLFVIEPASLRPSSYVIYIMYLAVTSLPWKIYRIALVYVAYFLQRDTVTGPVGVQKHIFRLTCEASLQCLETFTGVLLSRELYFNTVHGHVWVT
ncbi:hypothetical protein KUCAC02_031894, partial [Chaenocephalus aceratus]